jgi:phosphoribosylanthranilate isomerase
LRPDGGGSYEELHRELEGVRIVQVIHVTGPESLQETFELARGVQALLLDSGRLARSAAAPR